MRAELEQAAIGMEARKVLHDKRIATLRINREAGAYPWLRGEVGGTLIGLPTVLGAVVGCRGRRRKDE